MKLMITDFEVVEEGEAPQPPADIDDYVMIPDDSLDSEIPFG